MDVPSRHRPLLLLAAVIVGQVLMLAFQVKRGSDVPLIRVWSTELLTPLQRAGSFALSKIAATWFGYVDLRNTRSDNRKLAEEVGELQLKNEQLQGQAAEAVRLAKLLGFRRQNENIPMIAAEVIGSNADSNSHTVFINRGDRDGVRRNMPVITPDGIVGKIFEVLSHTSQVLLITDRESGVGALLAETRTHGVVKGTGDPLLWLDYVSADQKVSAGAEVLTSGEDRIFPKDIPIGIVAWTKPGFPFQTIELRPAAHLDSLEEVLVLLTEQPLNLRQKDETKSSEQNRASTGSHEVSLEPSKRSAPAVGTAQRTTKPSATDSKKPPEPPIKKAVAATPQGNHP